MPALVAEAFRKMGDAAEPDVVEQMPFLGAVHLLDRVVHHALAERVFGDAHLLDLELLEYLLEYQRSGDDNIRPAAVEPVEFGPLLHVLCPEDSAGDREKLLAREPEIIKAGGRIVAAFDTNHIGDAQDCDRCAYGDLELRILDCANDGAHQSEDKPPALVDGLRIELFRITKPLCQADSAHLQAVVVQNFPLLADQKLRAAAADVN